MRRLSPHYFTFLFYIPRIICIFRNWPLYIVNYVGRRKNPAHYNLRNGHKLIDATGTLAGTIAVVFLRREYGSLNNLRTIVDIGANMGAFTIYSAGLSRYARIYCYEPEEKNFLFLRCNIEANSLSNRVYTFRTAVASCEGRRNIMLGSSPVHSFFTNNEGMEYQMVSCTTLSKIIESQGLEVIDLLKINCEGTEYEIFENCERDIFERIINIRLEYHNIDSDRRNGEYLSSLLKSKGYEIQRFSKYREISGFIWARRRTKMQHNNSSMITTTS